MESINLCKIIAVEDRDACDYNISQNEVLQAVRNLKNNKSPGCDGITSEFYKMFSTELAPFLTKVFTESIEN